MSYRYILLCSTILIQNSMVRCASAAVHNHLSDNHLERESDGSYKPRDFEHYTDSGHNPEFDHEAILGSVKEAEEYDKLSPEESRERLKTLLIKMDLNGDQHIDRLELKKWILNSFRKLSQEEAEDRLKEADDNRDGAVSWAEYLQDGFGVDAEDEVAPDDVGENGMLLKEEKLMWKVADANSDGKLDIFEFEVFVTPEEHEVMYPFLLNQTLRDKDKNQDGLLDFNEFMGERDSQHDTEWVISERDKFENDLDTNRDGVLDKNEILDWIIPDNEEIADEEVDHLFEAADDNRDDQLTFDEILLHQNVFVGSEADSDLPEHYNDEL